MVNIHWVIRILLYFLVSVYLLFTSEEEFAWIHILLYSAVLLWMPVAIKWSVEQAYISKWVSKALLPSGIMYGMAIMLPNGVVAGAMSTPWLLLAIISLGIVLNGTPGEQQLRKWLIVAAYLFWIVGAVWGVSYQLDYRLMGFPKVIVALTAAHFHFAGFLLTLLTAYLTQLDFTNRWINSFAIGILVLMGIPLTALGILLTHLTGIDILETIAGVTMAAAGFGVAIAFLLTRHNALVKVGAIALSLGMILAFLFAMRSMFPVHWLDIPSMYTWHGSMNTIAIGSLTVGCLSRWNTV
jgi:hypothetical protein